MDRWQWPLSCSLTQGSGFSVLDSLEITAALSQRSLQAFIGKNLPSAGQLEENDSYVRLGRSPGRSVEGGLLFGGRHPVGTAS